MNELPDSYEGALICAGAKVLRFKEFGSYQGDWIAHVVYNGERGYATGNYGSCSGCDSFQSEFGYEEMDTCREHEYTKEKVECEACKEAFAKHRKHLSDFGKTYLDGIQSQEAAEKHYEERKLEYFGDEEANQMLEFVKGGRKA